MLESILSYRHSCKLPIVNQKCKLQWRQQIQRKVFICGASKLVCTYSTKWTKQLGHTTYWV